MFIPETDKFLRIIDFHEFYNEDEFQIDYWLPDAYRSKSYAMGQPVPIPFANRGQVMITDTEQNSSAAFIARFPDSESLLVVQEVAAILRGAETGAFEEQHSRGAARRYQQQFPLVLESEPVHSRYWLEQFELALYELRRQKLPSRVVEIVRERLRGVARDWLNRFVFSSDIKLLTSFLVLLESILLRREMRALFYAIAMHWLAETELYHLYTVAFRGQAGVVDSGRHLLLRTYGAIR